MKSLIERIKNARLKSVAYYGLFGISCLIFLEEYITVTETTMVLVDTICPIILSLAIVIPLWIWSGEQDRRREE